MFNRPVSTSLLVHTIEASVWVVLQKERDSDDDPFKDGRFVETVGADDEVYWTESEGVGEEESPGEADHTHLVRLEVVELAAASQVLNALRQSSALS